MVHIIPVPTSGTKCDRCSKNIFGITTPFGGSGICCPLCNIFCSYKQNKMYEALEDYNYCFNCNILFDIGRKHAENGCTDDIHWGILIEKCFINNELVIGMPVFDSPEECIKLFPTLNPTFKCMSTTTTIDNFYCSEAYYPQHKYPENYSDIE